MIPGIPLNCIGKLSDTELDELWHQLIVELMDAKYAGRTHGNRRTYDAGCTGPLCKKDVREHGRRRNKTTPSERYKYLDLILELWGPQAQNRLAQEQEAILQKLAPVSHS